ncbi:zinc-dependent metalloprotease [Horticoccus luteus]|uniref:Zinc-dependent metalloprotease n=1 Tax=Horticoccus luteus TaxID=2862869 RepID=A0A8F9TV06_9BACT|nr:M12 family metallo-peptidase [Horticoccus luteus]QYM79575.1 zinc-dependent metalloprotease [Horticoccus luteus]
MFAYTAAPSNAAQLEKEDPAPAKWLRYVELNPAMVRGKQAPFWKGPAERRLTIPLPDGRQLSVQLDPARMRGAQHFVATGAIEGREGSRVIFASVDGIMQASVRDPELGTFTLRQYADGTTQFFEVDEGLIPACGGDPLPRPLIAAGMPRASRRPTAAAAGGANDVLGEGGETHFPEGSAVDTPVVQVMMLYSQAVLTSTVTPSVVQGVFDIGIQKVNDAMAFSHVNARVELVRVAQVAYNETASASSKVQSDALAALRAPGDGQMDEIHDWRNEAGADLVCLALRRADASSSGLGYLLQTAGDNDNADFAFSVVQYDYIGSSDVVPHELGHNFGCAHDRENADHAGAFSYSYGYRFYGANSKQYRTIMAYAPGSGVGFYSNPNINAPAPIAVPLGIAHGLPGESDNAGTISQTAFEVSQFRLQQQNPSLGSLVNVSTRAYVGDGEQQLIGGFVVAGADSKRILLRAIGPTLAAPVFGVTDAETNPSLTIHQLGVAGTVAANDDWGLQTLPAAASDVVTASQTVGAFALPNGSRDAALLVDLPAGGYTVNVTGESHGEALVEAYELDGAVGKLINLSTRGYVETARPMIGGFVIHGSAGRAKRVLIRVLGPTLESYGVANALNDPYLSLYDGGGQLLLNNDDWSADAQDVISTHAEEAIVATGLMPLNRREPAVLLDLVPGAYTVVVKPFERLPDQPAQPGVGIVEVYEIDQ